MSTVKEIIDNYILSREGLTEDLNALTDSIQNELQGIRDNFNLELQALQKETLENLRELDDPTITDELAALELQTLELLQEVVYPYEDPEPPSDPIGNPDFPEGDE